MPDLVYKITTDAELTAMEAAVKDTEAMARAAAQTGKAVDELTARIQKMNAAIQEYRTPKVTIDSGAATTKVYGPGAFTGPVIGGGLASDYITAADETERYNEALRKMAQEARNAEQAQAELDNALERGKVATAMKAEQAAAQADLAAMAQAPLSEQTKQLAGMAAAKDKAAKAGHGLTGQFRTLHAAMAPVIHSIPGMNVGLQMMHHGFNATMGVIALVAVALHELFKAYKRQLEHFDYSKEKLKGYRELLEAEKDAYRRLSLEASAYNYSLRILTATQESVASMFKRVEDARANRRSAEESLDDAQENLEIERARVVLAGDEGRLRQTLLQIEERHAEQRRQRAIADAHYALDSMRREEASTAARAISAGQVAGQKRREFGGLQTDVEKRDKVIEDVAASLSSIDEKIKKEEDFRKESKHNLLLGVIGMGLYATGVAASKERQSGLETEKEESKVRLRRLKEQQDRDKERADRAKQDMDAAQKEREDAIRRGMELTRQIPDEERRLQVRITEAAQQARIEQQTRRWQQLGEATDPRERARLERDILSLDFRPTPTEPLRTPAATSREARAQRQDTLGVAARAADMVSAGEQLNEEQKRAMREATALLGLTGRSIPQIVAILRTLNDSQEKFAFALKQIENRVSENARRIQGIR